MILWLSVGASWIPPTLVFPLLDLTWIFPALNEMEEVAHEEGVAAGLGQNEAPAHNQAVVPMEVDEEQAGDVGLGKKLPFDIPFFWGVNLFSVSLVLRGFLQLGCLVWNGDASTAYSSEVICSVLKVLIWRKVSWSESLIFVLTVTKDSEGLNELVVFWWWC